MTALLFVVAAAAGGGIRWAITTWWPCTWQALLAVNVAGSFVLGLLVGAEVAAAMLTVAGTGLAGSLTTFSSFALEMLEHRPRTAIAHVALTVVACVGTAGVAMTF